MPSVVPTRLLHLWRCHSRTITCLTVGPVLITGAWQRWPDGGNAWDVVSGLGVVILAFGLEGIVNVLTEKNTAEE